MFDLIDSLVLVVALILDRILGEPRRFHPLVGFGNYVRTIERYLNKGKRWQGMVGWLLAVSPLTLATILIVHTLSPEWSFIISCAVVYFALGLNSLGRHALNVYRPLVSKQHEKAQQQCHYMVSRETQNMNENEMSRAVTESVLENGNDAVIATIVWFCIGGIPMVVLHRLVNTLDAMWGYKSTRFHQFGWFAAKADDVLAWPTAKVTALMYLMCRWKLHYWFQIPSQANAYKSLNGGWSIASGGYALGIELGGTSIYQGKTVESPQLGEGEEPDTQSILDSVWLVQQSTALFVLIIVIVSLTEALVYA